MPQGISPLHWSDFIFVIPALAAPAAAMGMLVQSTVIGVVSTIGLIALLATVVVYARRLAELKAAGETSIYRAHKILLIASFWMIIAAAIIGEVVGQVSFRSSATFDLAGVFLGPVAGMMAMAASAVFLSLINVIYLLPNGKVKNSLWMIGKFLYLLYGCCLVAASYIMYMVIYTLHEPNTE